MPVEGEQVAPLGVLGRVRRARVRDDPADQRPQLVRLGEDRHDIAVALGHLAAVEPGNGGYPPVDQRVGQREHGSVHSVEGSPDLTGDLHVLSLVEPDRHHLRGEEQDVGGHQHRVGEDAAVDALVVRPAGGAVGGHRRLVGVGAVQQALAGVAGEDPGELEHLWQVRLSVQRHAARVQPEREPGRRDLEGVAPQRRTVADRRERVGVGDEIAGVVAGGQRKRWPDHAEEVAEVRPAARPDARDRDRPRPRRRRPYSRGLSGRRRHPDGRRRAGLDTHLLHRTAPCSAGRREKESGSSVRNESAAPSRRRPDLGPCGCASAAGRLPGRPVPAVGRGADVAHGLTVGAPPGAVNRPFDRPRCSLDCIE